jgi:hypothetical protein
MRLGRRPSPPRFLFDPAKIDLVTQDRSGGANLYVVQDQPWVDSEAETESLEQKLGAYVTFALDGQMEEAYPQLRAEPSKIVIDTYVGRRLRGAGSDSQLSGTSSVNMAAT